MAKETNTTVDDVHLQRIYILYDKNGKFFSYTPIKVELIDQYFFKNTHRGPSWLRSSKKALASFFKYLYQKYDFRNVMDHLSFDVNLYRKDSPSPTILTRHGLLKLFHSIVSYSDKLDRDLLLFTLLISTGCSISEVLGIKVKHIKWDEETIYIPEAKGKPRTIVLRTGLTSSIKEYCKINHLKDVEENIFKINKKKVRRLFRTFLAKGNLPMVKLHSLRHSFATLMYESGSDITLIQQLLDHSELTTTKTYVHPNYIRNKNIRIKENDEIYSELKNLL